MSEGFTADVLGLEDVRARFATLAGAVRARVKTVIVRHVDAMVHIVKEEKLTGQVLGQKTGKLRGSINGRVDELSDITVTGIVGANMGEARYARFWEYGFTGVEQVREHLQMKTMAWGRPMKNPHQVTVRAHERTVNQPARSYLRSTLAEERAAILADLARVAAEGDEA
jgi:hypothetical protein